MMALRGQTGRERSVAGSVSKYAVLICFLLVFLVPIIWIWLSAFKAPKEISKNPFGIPEVWRWGNFAEAWSTGRFGQNLGNSLIYAVAIVGGVTILASLGGYALASLPLPAPNALLVMFMLGLMIPFESVMIPLFYLERDLHMLGTYWAFIIPGIALRLPFGIFLMRGFFKGLPKELADAARVDGANEWEAFRDVMLPLAKPGMSALIVFQFLWTWNQFLLPLVMVQKDELRPVSTGMMFFFGRFTAQRDLIAAGAVIAMIPVLVLYLLMQRRFIEGVTAGALKS
ncbi:MAG: carbohydrate ABC transporter permease [Thermomicrobiales bacterium]